MKVLMIGGTGTISMAISRLLIEKGHQLYLVNRGSRNQELQSENVHYITCDINDEAGMKSALQGLSFDTVADFIAYEPCQLERDYRLFKNITKQFIFISSASAYQKPLSDYRVSEGTPLSNPLWEYSRNKIKCEDYLMKLYREEGFPVTIVRPSHTYDERKIPMGVHGVEGSWAVAKRILEDKPVLIHGDGTSLWTMTHNRDFAVAFVGLMDNLHAIGEAVQIMSDETLTWNQIYQAIARGLGKELKAVHVASEFLAGTSDYNYEGSLLGDKANSLVFDNSKIKRLVPEFNATTRFDQGVKETIDYVLTHSECQVEDPDFDAYCDRVIEALDKAKNHIIG